MMTEYGIGVFDSGVGGLSVVQHLIHQLPHEHFYYVADSAHAPYGEKTDTFIIERCIAITDFFIAKKIKALVVACNTATAAAVAQLRAHYPDLIIVGIEPGLKPAIPLTRTRNIGVLATKGTIASEKFNALKSQLEREHLVHYFPQACVGLVNEIEKGDLNTPAIHALLDQYITPLIETHRVDVLVLGCTHYPFVRKQMTDLLAKKNQSHIQVIDTGEAIARRLYTQLAEHQLLKPQKEITTMLHLQASTTGQLAPVQALLQHALTSIPAKAESVNIPTQKSTALLT